MRIVLLFITGTLSCMNILYGQSIDNNIWQIAERHLIEVGDLSPRSYGYNWLYNAETGMVSTTMHVIEPISRVDVVPDMELPVSDSLLYYNFSSNIVHAPIHLMFAKGGEYVIIDCGIRFVNMDANGFEKLPCHDPAMHNIQTEKAGRKEILDLIEQGVRLCEFLRLNYDESVFVFKEIIAINELNIKNSGGVKINMK